MSVLQIVCQNCGAKYKLPESFQADKATFFRRDGDVATRLEVAVSPEDDVEVRRLTVHNRGPRVRELEVTSYAEMSLATPLDDFAHPAFAKLFVETQYLADDTALLCRRRPRSPGDECWALHVLSLERGSHGSIEWETDRMRFIGRGRSLAAPCALDDPHPHHGGGAGARRCSRGSGGLASGRT